MNLFQAIINKDINEINRLLEEEEVDIFQKSENNYNSLHKAVSTGFECEPRIIKILLKKSSEFSRKQFNEYINLKNNKDETPLFLACQNASDWSGHEEAIKLLISNGADLNIQDENGNTPLHIALYQDESMSICELLINQGARLDIENSEGETVRDMIGVPKYILELMDEIDRQNELEKQNKIKRTKISITTGHRERTGKASFKNKRVSKRKKSKKKKKKSKKRNKTRKLRKKKRVKKRKKSKKKKITKKNMKGGLKPTDKSFKLNTDDPQVDNGTLLEFYQANQEEISNESGNRIFIYPPMEFNSELLHSERGNIQFERYIVSYKITEKLNKNQIKIETSNRGINNISAEETWSIESGKPHRNHQFHPKRIQATIEGQTYFVKEIDNGENIITLFEDIMDGELTGKIVTISRNRHGDFIIYTDDPTTIRYLDDQVKIDYLTQYPGRLKLGHFSLLKTPEDYTIIDHDGIPLLRGNETDTSRSEDKILYAGTITWRHDGKALFYNNDCGRYEPDEEDTDYLAKINPEFQIDKITATTDETEGEAKIFYRTFDHKSGKVTLLFCQECQDWVNIEDMRYEPSINQNLCFEHYPIAENKDSHSGLGADGSCGTCQACRGGWTEHCMNSGIDPDLVQRELTWKSAPPARSLIS